MTKTSDLAFDNEYSRLIGTISKDALLRIQQKNILISGIKGLGIEIAKNVTLMGVKKLTIHDPEPVALVDLSSNFFLTEEDVGKPRAQAVLSKLQELNERVELNVYSDKLNDDILKHFSLVVVTNNRSYSELLRISTFCHQNQIQFIFSDVRGLYGLIFVDFGDTWIVNDPNGEEPKTGYIEAITQDTVGTITVAHGERHDLEDGDVVRISEVKGMKEVNGREFTIQVKNPTAFSIGDTSLFSNYSSGGLFEQVKIKKEIKNSPLSSFFGEGKNVDPNKIQMSDWSKFQRPPVYHLFTQALLSFQEEKKQLPRPYNSEDADSILALVKKFNQALPQDQQISDLDEKLLRLLSFTSSGDLSPMSAFFGGVIAHEIIKGCSGKYTPIDQWFYFDALECLPTEDKLPNEEEAAPRKTRYDGQIAVFGIKFQQKLSNLKYFLVGSGAIGCESLKNWALMGVGTGPEGIIHVTDMDQIEISNLNRQFLYRQTDVGKFKSEVAAAAARKMNPSLKLQTYTTKVGPETENIFDDDFWTSLSGVQNALDNVPARLYVDSRCVFYGKSLLESGTLGTKGNVQVIVRHLTESYGSSPDPPQKETPMCTLHSFPNIIQHCLQWAREDMFEGHFSQNPELVNNYLENQNFLSTLSPSTLRPTVEKLKSLLVDEKPSTFEDCIKWARLEFEKQYDNRIRQLLYNFPEDYVDSHGTPFWSGAKRAPHPLKFDPNEPNHLDFIVSASFLRAYNFGILDSELKPHDLETRTRLIAKAASSVVVPGFKPKAGVKIETDENATTATTNSVDDDDDQITKKMIASLPKPEDLKNWRMKPVAFEKDDDNNFHIDFISSASNLRASAYNIPTVDRLKSKLIAGRIIPAIVTTTAAVTGLVGLEFYKLHQEGKGIAEYRNSFLNLALPLFQQSEPIAASKFKYLPLNQEYTLWDKIEIRLGDVTLEKLIEWFEREHNMTVEMIGAGVALIYSDWVAPAKKQERLGKPVSELVKEIGKVTFHPKQKFFSLEITGNTKGTDVEDMPDVYFYFR